MAEYDVLVQCEDKHERDVFLAKASELGLLTDGPSARICDLERELAEAPTAWVEYTGDGTAVTWHLGAGDVLRVGESVWIGTVSE